jgi:hypothetical protein
MKMRDLVVEDPDTGELHIYGYTDRDQLVEVRIPSTSSEAEIRIAKAAVVDEIAKRH